MTEAMFKQKSRRPVMQLGLTCSDPAQLKFIEDNVIRFNIEQGKGAALVKLEKEWDPERKLWALQFEYTSAEIAGAFWS